MACVIGRWFEKARGVRHGLRCGHATPPTHSVEAKPNRARTPSLDEAMKKGRRGWATTEVHGRPPSFVAGGVKEEEELALPRGCSRGVPHGLDDADGGVSNTWQKRRKAAA